MRKDGSCDGSSVAVGAGRTIDRAMAPGDGGLGLSGRDSVTVIADLVQTCPDRVREMIRRFNEMGMRSLDPLWAGGRTRRISDDDRALIVKVAKKRPRCLGQPFTRWSIRKLQRYLAAKKRRKITIGRERLRQILAEEGITFQRTKTWKESPDALREQKLARVEEVLERHRDRVFAFDEFGPLAIKPEGGGCWAQRGKPQRLPCELPQDAWHQAALCVLVDRRRLFVGVSPQGEVGAERARGYPVLPQAASRR